jgi:hypothetical protein
VFDSRIIILELESFDASKKHSSKVLHGIISAFESIDKAAKCEYAPNVP